MILLLRLSILESLFQYFFLAFAFFTPLSRRISGTCLSVAVLIWLILIQKNKLEISVFMRKPLIKPLIYLYIGLIISLLFSLNISVSIHEYWKMFTFVVPVILLAANSCCRKPLLLRSKAILQYYLFGCSVTSLYAIFQYLQTQSLHVTSVFIHHAILGSVLAIGIPISIILFFQNKSAKWKGLYLCQMLICTFALILTQARGPWIGTTLAVLFIVFIMRRKLSENKRSLGIVVLVITLFGVATIPFYLERAKTITDLTWGSNYHRLLIWQSAFQMIRDYPLTGIGLKMFYPIYNNYYISPLSQEPFHMHAHNSILMYAIENGLINASLFIYLLYDVVIKLYKQVQCHLSIVNVSAMTTVIAIVTTSMADSFFWSSNTAQLMWLVIGLSLFADSNRYDKC